MTALTVSGRPSSRVQRAASSFFACPFAKAADAVREAGLGALDADLDVGEPGVRQRRELVAGQHDGRGDQVRIEPDLGRARDERDEILARRRLAAREMDLEHAQVRELVDHPEPFVGGEFRLRRSRARPGSSNRGTAAGSDASVRREPPAGRRSRAARRRRRGSTSWKSASAAPLRPSGDGRRRQDFRRRSDDEALVGEVLEQREHVATDHVGARPRISPPARRRWPRRCGRRPRAAAPRAPYRRAPGPARARAIRVRSRTGSSRSRACRASRGRLSAVSVGRVRAAPVTRSSITRLRSEGAGRRRGPSRRRGRARRAGPRARSS